MAVLDLFTSLLDQVELNAMQETIQEFREDRLPAQMGTLGEQIQQAVTNEEESRSLWWVVLVVTLLFAVMALMFLSFRKKNESVQSAETIAVIEMPDKEKKTVTTH